MGEWRGAFSPAGIAVLPCWGGRCSLTGVRVFPNGGFDFPQRRVSPSPTEQGVFPLRVATNPVTNSRTEPRRTRRNLTISVSRRSSAAPLSVKNHPHPNPFRAFRVFRGYIREGSHSLCLVTQKRFFRTPPCATRRVLLYYALLFRRNSSDTVRKALGTGRLTRPVYRSNTPAECRESAAGVFLLPLFAQGGN